MNGIAALVLSLLAGNVLLGLSVYVLAPMLLKPFIVYLAPAANGLFYPETIRAATADCSLVGTLMSIMWLLVFIIAGYAAMGLRLHRAIDIG